MQLPRAAPLIAAGRALTHRVVRCPFLSEYGVDCEATCKRARMDQKAAMLHAQMGYRNAEKSRRANREIHARLADTDIRLDRFGICLDWSMGYPAQRRAHTPKGTGLILDSPEAFSELSACSMILVSHWSTAASASIRGPSPYVRATPTPILSPSAPTTALPWILSRLSWISWRLWA